jgi:hypothetical protein
LRRLANDIVLVLLPDAIFWVFRADYLEVDRYIFAVCGLFVRLHEGDKQLRPSLYNDTVLWVVKPPVITIHLDHVTNLLISVDLNWTWPAICLPLPDAIDRVLLPLFWEYSTDVELVVVLRPVLVRHPPGAVVGEAVAKLCF